MLKKHQSFSLIELLLVITILFVLATLLQPSLKRVLSQSQDLKCQTNLKQLLMGMQIYTDNNDDVIMPFALPQGEKAWFHLNNWTGILLKEVFNLSYSKNRFDSVEDFKTASCPNSDQRFGYGHNYRYLGAQKDSTNWLIKHKITEATLPQNTTFLVDNMLTEQSSWGVSKNEWEHSWRSFVRPGGISFQDNRVNFTHTNESTNVGWLDGHVSARYMGDGFYQPGSEETNKKWWALIK